MPGWAIVTTEPAAEVTWRNPVIEAVIVVVPERSGRIATPPEVVSVGVFELPIGIVAVWLAEADGPALSRSATAAVELVKFTVSALGAPKRTFCSWVRNWGAVCEFGMPVRA